MPGPLAGRSDFAASSLARFGNGFLELAGRIHRIDEAAFDGALAAHAFGQRAEVVGEIAADLSLVDDARQATGPGHTPRSGVSGSPTDALPSSTSTISSHASASS